MDKFTAEIKKIEDKDASYIEIPFDVEKVYGAKRVKVKATFDGYEYRGSIVKMGLPCYMLGITKEIRKAIGKTFGELIEVTIEKDEAERTIDIPSELLEVLNSDAEIKGFWDTLSFTTRKEYARAISSAKREETKIKRLNEINEKLKNKIK